MIICRFFTAILEPYFRVAALRFSQTFSNVLEAVVLNDKIEKIMEKVN